LILKNETPSPGIEPGCPIGPWVNGEIKILSASGNFGFTLKPGGIPFSA